MSPAEPNEGGEGALANAEREEVERAIRELGAAREYLGKGDEKRFVERFQRAQQAEADLRTAVDALTQGVLRRAALRAPLPPKCQTCGSMKRVEGPCAVHAAGTCKGCPDPFHLVAVGCPTCGSDDPKVRGRESYGVNPDIGECGEAVYGLCSNTAFHQLGSPPVQGIERKEDCGGSLDTDIPRGVERLRVADGSDASRACKTVTPHTNPGPAEKESGGDPSQPRAGMLPRCGSTEDTHDGKPCARHAGHHSDCRSADHPYMKGAPPPAANDAGKDDESALERLASSLPPSGSTASGPEAAPADKAGTLPGAGALSGETDAEVEASKHRAPSPEQERRGGSLQAHEERAQAVQEPAARVGAPDGREIVPRCPRCELRDAEEAAAYNCGCSGSIGPEGVKTATCENHRRLYAIRARSFAPPPATADGGEKVP